MPQEKTPFYGFPYEEKMLEILKRIFKLYGFSVLNNLKEQPSNRPSLFRYCDIVLEKQDKHYYVESKFPLSNCIPNSTLLTSANYLVRFASDQTQNGICILVAGCNVPEELRQALEKKENFIILDIQNLLFLVQINEAIKNDFLSLLNYSTENFLPKCPKTDIFNIPPRNSYNSSNTSFKHIGKIFNDNTQDLGNELKDRVANWSQSFGDKKYEKLCYDVLHYLFSEDLSLWKRQQRSNQDLYRFDLICKIKDGICSGLWYSIVKFLNTKYVIFEFKNYKEKITQKEIYTTDKYLYSKAFRSVAILISLHGPNSNAVKAIKGTLRENGKLILSVTNSDLIKMIDMKLNNSMPSDYLYELFDNLFIELEK